MSAGQNAGMNLFFGMSSCQMSQTNVNINISTDDNEDMPCLMGNDSSNCNADGFHPPQFNRMASPSGCPMNRYPGLNPNFLNSSNGQSPMALMMDLMMTMMVLNLLMQLMNRMSGGRLFQNMLNGGLGQGSGFPGMEGFPGMNGFPGMPNAGLPGGSTGAVQPGMPGISPLTGGGSPDFDKALRHVLKWEGGLSDDPGDHGGLTNKGITHGEFSSWLSRHGQPQRSVSTITNSEMRQIYYEDYWKASGADKMSGPMATAMFDTAVNMGVGAAKKLYRQSGGDFNTFMQLRRERYYQIASHPGQGKFLKGWINRLNDLQRTAVA